MTTHEKQAQAEREESANISIGGEDDASTEREGDDSHLHDDQKSRSFPTASAPEKRGETNSEGENRAGAGDGQDAGADGHAHDENAAKVQDLAKVGRPRVRTH
ncbi:hypothetical protein V3I01_05430 [Sphingomonas sp. gentR]|jgi:hypothetical protein|uniref:hypothetical protein n=1 Tax=unclassified Sphingomonas TaxID=196159 RepID=UPI0012ECAB90|nr:hypothetical protein [Sphingomonas sp. LK11]